MLNFRKSLLFFLLVLGVGFCFGQESNIWYFGQFAGIDFNSGSPVALTNSAMNTLEACASVSDNTGSLLFYTNGMTIWNRNHVQMANGGGLNGGTSATQTLIVKQPNSTRYYVFSVPNNGATPGLIYAVVDMSQNGGLGAVLSKNTVLSTSSSEKIGATFHSNGTDCWVLAHEWGNSRYRAYLVNSTGLVTTPVISNVGMIHGGSFCAIGELKFDRTGSLVAVATQGCNRAEVLSFDNSTGTLSNPVTLFSVNAAYGIEFSPSSQYLYVSERRSPPQLLQYNLLAGSPAAIQGSRTLIAGTSAQYFCAMQLGPDNRIYAALHNSQYLGVINNPDIGGTGCNYVDNGFFLAGRNSQYGLPGVIHDAVVILDANDITLQAYANPEIGVDLYWEVEADHPYRRFEVQRSAFGSNFETWTELSASAQTRYRINDSQPLQDLVFYRIRAIDHNGQSHFSEVRMVQAGDQPASLVLAPNPAHGSTVAHWSLPEAEVHLELRDLTGRLLQTWSPRDEEALELDLQGVAPGIYLVSLLHQGRSLKTQRLLVQ